LKKSSFSFRFLACTVLGITFTFSTANAQNKSFEFDKIEAVRISYTAFRVEGKRAGVEVQSDFANWIPADRNDFCYKLAVVAFTQGQPYSITIGGDNDPVICEIGKGKAL
jgi:hypothetical protein